MRFVRSSPIVPGMGVWTSLDRDQRTMSTTEDDRLAVQRAGIFREKALRAYLENRQKVVLPKLSRPSVFPYYWVLIVLLLAGFALLWSSGVPVQVRGAGIVLVGNGLVGSAAEKLVLLMLLPPAGLAHLAQGQRVFARIDLASG